MHDHDHLKDDLDAAARPKSAHLDSAPAAHLIRAAAAGRTDVLGGAGILGLQRAVGNAGVGAVLEDERSSVHDVIGSGGGSALAPDVQAEMSSRLGHDFSDVRVHNDSAAHESAKSVNAQAYTVGSNVVFQRDKFDTGSTAGKTMLAHELTHVVQQRSGPVDGTPSAGGIKVSDPSDRFEQEAAANADRVMAAPLPTTSGPEVQTAVQRHGEQDDEVAQTIVQREEVEGEDEAEETAQTFVQREEESEEAERS